MAREIIDRQISISQYWRENFSKASQYFFMARFALGLERLREKDQKLVSDWEKWREQHKFRKTESKPKRNNDLDHSRRCLRCTIILTKCNDGKYCASCAREVRDRILLAGFKKDELADFVIL